MAHVHGAAGAAQTSKHAAHAAHGAHAAHAAHGAAAASHAHHAMQAAPAAASSFHNLAKGAAATSAVATAGTQTGKSFLGKLVSHPLVIFGLGVAVGYAIHKYRKEIIESANRAVEKSQDFVLQQRENLEDLVAEAPESEN